MSREFDRRSFSTRRLTPEREADLHASAAAEGRERAGIPEARIVSFDTITGNPTAVLGAAPPAGPGDYVQRALDYLSGFHDTLGFAPTQPTEFQPDPHVLLAGSGAAAVHMQQLYKGIPIFQANQAVQFNPQGVIEGTLGQSVSIEQEHDSTPTLSADAATLIAARYVAAPQLDAEPKRDQFDQPLLTPTLNLAGYTPTIISRDDTRADQRTRLSPGPFAEPPQATLIWFYDDPTLDLAWEILLTMPDYSEQYRVLINAADGELLYCHQLVQHIAAQGNVYLKHGGTQRRFVDFPLPLESYGLPIPNDLPAGFPGDWVNDDIADGNNVYAHLDEDGPTIGGTLINGAVVFNPRQPIGNAQRILNAFYYVNRIHNFFYLLGFRESDGNFQLRNTGPGGIASDPVDARVYVDPINRTATMTTPIDGTSPIMRMGPVGVNGRHTALDASVVYHEYTHGVTNRLVGGPRNGRTLDAVQSQALGEGFSDFFACIATDSTVVGAWVIGSAGGMRSAPYDPHYPGSFDDLGQGYYREIHAAGEIWCAALMELSRTIDRALCLRLVMDSLRLMPANPSFLQARDAIFRALDYMQSAGEINAAAYTTTHAAAWRAFARFGMGPNATTPHAFILNGSADHTPPALNAGLTEAPEPALPVTATVDDFSRLPELDERSERKLHGAGIIRFADLAACTPAQLARIIARRGMTAERITELGWVGTARMLAEQPQDSAGILPEHLPAAPSDERQRTTSFTLRLNIRPDGQVRKLAIVHVRDGAHEEWENWNEPGMLAFIRRHAAIRSDVAPPAAQTGVTQRLAEPAPTHHEAEQQVRAHAHLSGETLSRPQGDDRLRVELRFEVPGAVEPARYIWQILARRRDNDAVEVLADGEGELDPEHPEQQIRAVVDLPKTDGRYRLNGLVRIPEWHLLLEVPGPPLSVEAS